MMLGLVDHQDPRRDPRNYANGPLLNMNQVIDGLFAAEDVPPEVPPMPAAEVEALERRVHVVHGLLVNQEITCPICLDTVAPGEEVVLPGCAASEMHAGHVGCIERWLARSGICAVCREELGDTD